MNHSGASRSGEMPTIRKGRRLRDGAMGSQSRPKGIFFACLISALPQTPIKRKRATLIGLLLILASFLSTASMVIKLRLEKLKQRQREERLSETNQKDSWRGFGQPSSTAAGQKKGDNSLALVYPPPPPSLTGTETYTMILPLVCKEVATAQLLISTLHAFTDPKELQAIYIVADANDLPCVEARLRNATVHLKDQTGSSTETDWPSTKLVFLSSESLIPELVHVPHTAENVRYFVPYGRTSSEMLQARSFGYIIQMLVKLAIAEHVQTDYYITLDADILCTRPMKYQDIFLWDNRDASSNNTKRRRKAVNNPDFMHNHRSWWNASDRILQTYGLFSSLDHEAKAMGVTPAILHRNSVLQLHRYLETLYEQPWRSFLIEYSTAFQWTEYTLYYTYALASGLFRKYHLGIDQSPGIHVHNPLYARANIWNPKQLTGWDWASSFDPKATGNGYFLVTQASLTGHNVTVSEYIASSIRPYLPKGTLPQ
jgi:hypothetical protein